MSDQFTYGPWLAEYRPGDGGRLSRLSYGGFDLLTAEPSRFVPPAADLGQYERRPVFGYDDCFPSVGACRYPGTGISVPDHGELCWLGWDVNQRPANLAFSVRSRTLPLLFMRSLAFSDSAITWNFEVRNEGNDPLPFQHVMHPLFRPEEITDIQIPGFASAFDWERGLTLEGLGQSGVRDLLLTCAPGSTAMLFLRNVEIGEIGCTFRDSLRLRMKFPVKKFPTIGIWWNNRGYPDEEGLRRSECAFEPTPGMTSNLAREAASGSCLSVEPRGRLTWQVGWEMETAT